MAIDDRDQRREWESLSRQELEARQLAKLNQLLERILPQNEFYAAKLAAKRLRLNSLSELEQLPFTTKDELQSGDSTGFAANLTFPLERYVRFHRTSGTKGRPLVVLDTAEDWQWWIDAWQYVLDVAELTAADRVLMAFSFGPFIGFWTAHDAAIQRGALVIPGGSLSSLARLEVIRSHRVTALFCTPSYALHLIEIAQENSIDPGELGVRCIIVAGEPGGSAPAIRDRIATAWNARVIDHAGATEVGPWGYADAGGRGLRVIEREFIAEVLATDTQQPVEQGQLGELVLTSLGRAGSPVIRYRTGDMVRPRRPTGEANQFLILEGGVLGRVDDMMIIRGVNVFPTAVEEILRRFSDVAEYRLIASREKELDVLRIEVEAQQVSPDLIAQEVQLSLGLRVDVRKVPRGSLPRFEAKGKRFIDERGKSH